MFGPPYEDESITCADCKQPFTFTAGEKSFFDEKNFTTPPKRCKPCREAKKASRGASAR